MTVIGRSGVPRHIRLDPTESVAQARKAIARASFEVAELDDIERNRPALAQFGLEHASFKTTWNEQKMLCEVRKCDPAAQVGEPLPVMDDVETVRGKTEVHRSRKYLRFFPGDGRDEEADVVLVLTNYYYRSVQPSNNTP